MASAQLSAGGQSIFSQNILKILGASEDYDVTLRCGGRNFQAHKIILSISSPRFAKIFDSNKDIKVANVSDVNSDIMDLLIKYIYSAKLDFLDMDIAPSLYEAASKYEISPLKRLCESYIIRNVKEENVCDVLLITEKFDNDKDSRMLAAVKSFVDNRKTFLKSKTWKFISERHKSAAKMLLDNL